MNILDCNELKKSLWACGVDLRTYGRIDSTNSEAKRIAQSERPRRPILFVAETQTAGRGRSGNSFYSAKDCGAYFSLLLPVKEVAESVCLTSIAAVAVFRAVRAVFGLETGIKWVNDLYWNGKKVCGILCEGVTDSIGENYVIVGVGINIASQDFPNEIKEIAGSLNADAGKRFDLIQETVSDLLELCETKDWLSDYRERSIVLDREVRFWNQDGDSCGKAVGIDESGGLEVLLPDGSRTVLRSGEIHLRCL